jgi:hypothetical protein
MSERENNKHPEEEATGFKVSDRRKFSADGELREPERPPVEDVETDPAPETTAFEDPSAEKTEEEIDFASLILSLATTALAHLGEVLDPATGEKTENLAAAKQMIDILSILETKTKGNLQPDEQRLLENLLYELRMKYLNKARIITV